MNYDVVRDLRQLADWAETVLLKIDKAGFPRPAYSGLLSNGDYCVIMDWEKPGTQAYRRGYERLDVLVDLQGHVDWELKLWDRLKSIDILPRCEQEGDFLAVDPLPEDFVEVLKHVVNKAEETQ